MMPRRLRSQPLLLGVWLLGLATLACQERLTSPGDCPTSCPADAPQVVDTFLQALASGDSTFTGYLRAGEGSALLVANQVASGEVRAVIRFAARQDSLFVQDTLRAYALDSVSLNLGLVGRDSLAGGLTLVVYRVPATVDTGVSFSQLDSSFVPANVIDTIVVPDSLMTGSLGLKFSGPRLADIAIPPADSGVLAIGIGLMSAAPSGVRLGSQTAGSLAPLFTSFVTVDVADTALQQQSIGRGPTFNTYVSAPSGFPPANLLGVGGAPSARSLIRFPFPDFLRDSAQIIRATIILVPQGPITGIPNDQGVLEVRGLQADVGAKSPLCRLGDTCGARPILRASQLRLVPGSTDTIRIEVIDIVRSWQGARGSPPSVFLLLLPEASSFTRAAFGSTRSGPIPRLRITYARPIDFELP